MLEVENQSHSNSYHLKWIQWNSGKVPIIMQSKNGPCPLIATMNVLLLREKIKLPEVLEQITADQLLTYLGECIMDSLPDEIRNDENSVLNYEQNIHDAMEILPKLKTGLDVNIRFTNILDFEYTPELIIFDLLRIPLYHGWLCDPQLEELNLAVGNKSYNQLVDFIITHKVSSTSTDVELQTRSLLAEDFLEKTASQLTEYGLNELRREIRENEIGILFRNNHFLTLFKRNGDIYTLVTDHGYLTEDNVIWETIDNIEGVGRFFDSSFNLSKMSTTTSKQVSEFNEIDKLQQQVMQDFMIACSLKEEEEAAAAANLTNSDERGSSQSDQVTSSTQGLDDFQLAEQLQAEEDRIYNEMMSRRNLEQYKPSQRDIRQANNQVVPRYDTVQQPQEFTSTVTKSSDKQPETARDLSVSRPNENPEPTNPDSTRSYANVTNVHPDSSTQSPNSHPTASNEDPSSSTTSAAVPRRLNKQTKDSNNCILS